MRTWPPSATSTCPGGSFSTPARPVPPGTYWSARYASIASGSTSCETPGSVSSAFSSEANASEPSGSCVQSRGFLPTPVPGEHEPLARPVPQCDREHARQVLGEPDPVLLVEVRDDGRVAGAADLVAALAELLAQLEEVVDLAVEDADDVTGLVLDRLAAGDEVDDLQAPVTEHAAAETVDRALVRPAMEERGVHPLDQGRVRRAGGC